nr:MAG TPA_asm: hypothetical protein [Caudoviricetes sp.]
MRNASSTAFSSFVIVVLIIISSCLPSPGVRAVNRRPGCGRYFRRLVRCSGLQLKPTTNRNAMQSANLELRCFLYNFCK